jgi:hypothetical protein
LHKPIQENTEPFIKNKFLNSTFGKIKSLVSFENIITSASIVFIFLCYFGSNSGSNMPQHGLIWNVVENTPDLWRKYILFCILEFGLYALVIFKAFYKDTLFITTVFVLSLIPLYCAGIFNDFAMRASIPAIVLLMVFVTRFFINTKNRVRKVILIVLLLIGGITPFNEIFRSVYLTSTAYSQRLADNGYTFGNLRKLKGIDKFVAIDPKKSWFFKYLSK